GDVATLEAGGTVPGEYAALASGTTIGTASVDATTDNAFVNVTINAAGITFLNSHAGSSFAFGGYLAGIPMSDTDTRYEFGASSFMVANDGNTYLTYTTAPTATPEPGTIALVGTLLAGLILKLRRARVFY